MKMRKKMDPVTKAATKLFEKWFDRISVDIMDISEVYKEIKAAIETSDVDSAMAVIVAKYRRD